MNQLIKDYIESFVNTLLLVRLFTVKVFASYGNLCRANNRRLSPYSNITCEDQDYQILF